MGKSRSATCVIAYLMSKCHISPQEALAQVKQCRPLVEPNDGFMQQLEMYHQMQTTINVEESPVYQRWMYQREVQLSSECGMAPDAEKIRFEDEHITPDEEGKFADAEFKCKKCRYVISPPGVTQNLSPSSACASTISSLPLNASISYKASIWRLISLNSWE